jgi:hypothetical protein
VVLIGPSRGRKKGERRRKKVCNERDRDRLDMKGNGNKRKVTKEGGGIAKDTVAPVSRRPRPGRSMPRRTCRPEARLAFCGGGWNHWRAFRPDRRGRIVGRRLGEEVGACDLQHVSLIRRVSDSSAGANPCNNADDGYMERGVSLHRDGSSALWSPVIDRMLSRSWHCTWRAVVRRLLQDIRLQADLMAP